MGCQQVGYLLKNKKQKNTAASLGTRVYVCNLRLQNVWILACALRACVCALRVCFACVRVGTREGPLVTRG